MFLGGITLFIGGEMKKAENTGKEKLEYSRFRSLWRMNRKLKLQSYVLPVIANKDIMKSFHCFGK